MFLFVISLKVFGKYCNRTVLYMYLSEILWSLKVIRKLAQTYNIKKSFGLAVFMFCKKLSAYKSKKKVTINHYLDIYYWANL